jgi:hypothetical protein
MIFAYRKYGLNVAGIRAIDYKFRQLGLKGRLEFYWSLDVTWPLWVLIDSTAVNLNRF